MIIFLSFEIPFMEPQRNIFMERSMKYNIPVGPALWLDIIIEEKFRIFL